MAQQHDTARHRGDFKATNHQPALARGNAQFWDTLPTPTADEVLAVRNAAIETQAILTVCGGSVKQAQKLLDHRREVKQAQAAAAAQPVRGGDLFRIGSARNRQPASLFEQAYTRLSGKALPSLERGTERKMLVGVARAFQLKSNGGMGEFAGYLSTFNGVDLGDDTVLPGAYADTVAAAKQKRAIMGGRYLWPILWQHQDNMPIGGFTDAKEDSNGLFVTGEIDLDTRAGKDAWASLSRGYVQGLSIGYNADKSYYQGNTRMLQQITLYEGSLVTFPMDTRAGVTRVGGNASSAPGSNAGLN